MVAVAQTPREPAGSFLTAVSEIGHRIPHARWVRPEVVTPSRSGGHLRSRAAAFPRRLYATATMEGFSMFESQPTVGCGATGGAAVCARNKFGGATGFRRPRFAPERSRSGSRSDAGDALDAIDQAEDRTARRLARRPCRDRSATAVLVALLRRPRSRPR